MNPTLTNLRNQAACLKPGLGHQPSAAEILNLIIALIDAVDEREAR
jgi:hypothetical protein